jgi:hypothetical protein
MAKVQYGSLITEIKGKIGGQVLQSSSAGHIIRNKGRFNRSSSQRINKQKYTVATIANNWRALTLAQQAAWSSACPSFLSTDVLGNKRTPSPFNLFMKCCLNANARELGILTTPGVPDVFNVVDLITAFQASTFPIVELNFGLTVPANQQCYVYCSGSNSQGRNSPVGGYKFVVNLGAPSPGFYQFQDQYVPIFGNPVLGAKIFCKVVIFSEISYTYSPPSITSWIVVS